MREYSAILRDHVCHPRNVGQIADADAVGRQRIGRATFMDMYFRIQDGFIKEVKFQTFGCGAVIAAGSMLTEMITNRTVKECLTVTDQQLIKALGGLPGDKIWCAKLALATMHDAFDRES